MEFQSNISNFNGVYNVTPMFFLEEKMIFPLAFKGTKKKKKELMQFQDKQWKIVQFKRYNHNNNHTQR